MHWGGIVELKAAAPLCDPDDTQEHAIVSAVTSVIRRMGMTSQVMLTSFSPALLYLADAEAQSPYQPGGLSSGATGAVIPATLPQQPKGTLSSRRRLHKLRKDTDHRRSSSTC